MSLEVTGAIRGTSATDVGNFPFVFALIALLSLSSALIFARLTATASAALVKRQPAG